MHHVQAVVEIFAKSALLHHLRQIAVRRADQPDIQVDRSAAAEPFKASFLQHAQQFRLQPQPQIANLIKE